MVEGSHLLAIPMPWFGPGNKGKRTADRADDADILPTVCSALDPESQVTVLRQTNALLSRLTMTLSTLYLTKPQDP